MFAEVFFFELKYRKKRTTTYVYFIIIFFVSFLTAASPSREPVGHLFANAPFEIANLMAVMSLIFTMIASAIMGVSIIRDFEHHMEAMLLTTSLKKIDYLFGRFAGSFVILILINSAEWLGLMTGFSIGEYLPWEVAWKEAGVLPFNFWSYFQPFLFITVINSFTIGSLFFMSGALGRSSIIIYTQGIGLLVLYQVGFTLARNIDTQIWAALIDPFGIRTIQHVARYWTPAQRNSTVIPMEGVLLMNRLLWISIGIVSLIITRYAFSFSQLRSSISNKSKKSTPEVISEPGMVEMPVINFNNGVKLHLYQVLYSSLLYIRMVIRDIPFLAMIITGIMIVMFNALKMTEIYGTVSYPTTFAVLRVLGSFNLIFIIISIFYSGELIWRERTLGFAPITDALPIPTFTSLLSKFIALTFIYVILLLTLVIIGALIQAAYGYFEFNLGIYAGTLFSNIFIGLLLYTLLSFFIQVLVNNKFLGFTLCIAFIILNSTLNQMGLEHDLWQFASGTLGTYSDMNHYGHFVTPFAWFKIYWLSFSLILFAVATVFSVRGSETTIRFRWKTSKLRIKLPLIIYTLTSITVFIFAGYYIYYNTVILNSYETTSEIELRQGQYEKKFKQYELLEQPKIVEANVKLNIHPSNRDFDAEGFYYLKNKTNKPVQQIHVQQNTDHQLHVEELKFDQMAILKEGDMQFRYFIYELKDPLLPGDSLKMFFKLSFHTEGFEESRSNTDIVYNGTFLTNSYFPSLGYDHLHELKDNSNRRKQGLQIKERMLAQDDPRGREINVLGDDADHIRFEMIVSTEGDQRAIAPGYLVETWQVENQRYYHYKMDVPMGNFYSMVSARYAVKNDNWKNVNLEIYYNPGHEFNLDRMMGAMKKSLDYYTTNFSPYQYGQLRIMEFPRYSEFAQSYANTIPFSEGIGFIFKVNNPERDMDMTYLITAHEVAHQWWGHQVMEANVKGSGLLSEGMSQYSALMVMKQEFAPETLGQYLKYELDNYLSGRATEKRTEQPLYLVEGQNYIQYSKSSIVFYALQDYIGEENVNRAFRNFNRQWAFKEAPYPTSVDLITELREVTPDSLQYLIHDMFETITIFENRAVDAVYSERGGGEYEVTLKVSCEKNRVDSLGVESEVDLIDWMDVGVFAGNRIIYLKKHLIHQKENTFTIHVNEEPTKAGIDPLYKLIDRHTTDNVANVTRLIEIGSLDIH